MSFEKWEREAFDAIPRGHVRVHDGELLPDDLVWSWPTKEFVRADDAEWMCRATRAQDCMLVIRKPRADTTGFTRARTYTIQKPLTAAAASPDTVRQDTLFE